MDDELATGASDRPIACVLCDVDGVLRLWDPDGMPGLDRAYGLPPGTLAEAVFGPERLTPAITGAVTDEQWRAAVAEHLVGVCGSEQRAQSLVDAWTAIEPRIDEEVLGLLAAARRYVPVLLVSNATTLLEEDLAGRGVMNAVDGIVNSSRIGFAKPDPRVYRLAARRAGVPASGCLFIDDGAANVAAAVAEGMSGLHYQHADQLRAALAPLLAV